MIGHGEKPGSIGWREYYSLLYFISMKKQKELHVYIDESGDFSPYSKENPLYAVSFVFVDPSEDNKKTINHFNLNLERLIGGNHFVHVGNLVRGEKPYEHIFREERVKLFYALYLFSYFAKYKVIVSSLLKDTKADLTRKSISELIINNVDKIESFLKKYQSIILHYDFGQERLADIITTAFVFKYPNCKMIKTKQSESPFMQIADLFAYFELLKYKVSKGFITKSERNFFGNLKNIKNSYLKNIADKYLI